jgi:hypothetical protein
VKRAAITIDVDSLRCYREIHGLGSGSGGTSPPADPTFAPLTARFACEPDAEEDPIYTRALPRFFGLLEEIHAPATLFLIGADAPRYAAQFAPAKALGAELASHSFAHDYRLIERSGEELKRDLTLADEALRPLDPGLCGFRAPGYNTSPALFAALTDLKYSYDSSRLPSPAYYLARAAAIRAYAALGRPSQSLTGELSAFTGSLAPHRVHGMLELPMSCEPLSRMPLFGTSIALLPSAIARAFTVRTVRALSYVNFEMHAIDLLDASEVPAELAKHQRDLRVPLAKKIAAFRQVFRIFREEAELFTLRDIARAEAEIA